MVARKNFVSNAEKKGLKRDDVIKSLQNPSDKDIDELISLGRLDDFFKSSTSKRTKRELIRLLPGVAGAGYVGSNSKENK
jgi:hypothetical protein